MRKRRIRVKVKPAGSSSEDFVTAESQSYDASSRNNLPHEPTKFRNFYVSSDSSASTMTSTTTTASSTKETEKSMFESFLDKMLSGAEESPTTILPEIMTTTSNSELNTNSEMTETNLKDNNNASPSTESHSTILKNRDEEAIGNTELPPSTTTILIDNVETHSTQSPSSSTTQSTTTPTTSTTTTTTTTNKHEKIEEIKSNSGENIVQVLNKENSLKYFENKSPAFTEYLRNQEKSKMSEDNPAHPKNHRSKWSEVRYPGYKWTPKSININNNNQSQESKRSEEEDKKKQNSGKTENVSDYVKAIFDSIKSADEEHKSTKTIGNETTTSSRKDKDLFNNKIDPLPTEVKTSVSSSSRVVSRPAGLINFSDLRENNGNPTTSTTTEQTKTYGPFVPSMMSDRSPGVLVKKTPLELNLGKILKTSTTTKVTHQTEICYRGRCVMSKPKKDGLTR